MIETAAAFGLTVILGVPTIALLRKMQSVQKISEFVPETHQAKKGTPTMGGLMMLGAFALLAVSSLFGWMPRPASLLAFSLTVLAFALIGFVDDYLVPKLTGARGLGWLPKLGLQLVVAAPISYYAFGAAKLVVTLNAPIFELSGATLVIAATLTIVGLANAFNLTDGLDGLAAGTMALAALGLLLGGAATLYAGGLVGVCLGFLVYNSPPARVFMGDVGSLALGAAFAFALLDARSISLWALVLCGVFLVEMVPVPIQIASVKLFKRKVFTRTPIHHAFELKGVPEKRITAGFVLAQALCTTLYLVLTRR